MGWDPRSRHPSLKFLRMFRVTGFEKILVLYRPMAEGIEIIRVIHGSRDLQRLVNQRCTV
jgi:plasmid stabilization system protein ParE